ncbi:PREDICTED: ZW10 interactor-like [Chrysochloris asiatica]|uniref:ZW10 interactor-like n=1 Tax=Chrysochloris asiatica TaxID=185453 RepID=A0A9B0T4W7_CHRAS|nr:PREDICTED: ZW10 interactor-like [Chrysochloris asiatica]
MEAAATDPETEAIKTLAEVSTILESTGLQEEAELPAQVLAEFVMDSRKKDKLLCSQLQVVDFLLGSLVNEDTVQDLASEDMSRQKATEAKEHWKELKATYQEHVEDITSALRQALLQKEEAQRKQAQLQEAIEQLQLKKQAAAEKLKAAQQQWQLQQEKHLQRLAEVRHHQRGTQQKVEQLHQELRSLTHQAGQKQDQLQRYQAFLQLLCTLQNKVLLPEAEVQPPQEWPLHQNIPEDKPQEQDTGRDMGGDGAIIPK